jgi:hypothetical protein
MGKKIPKDMQEQKEKLLKGFIKGGLSEKKSNEPKPRKKTEEEYSLFALDALVSLHEKRTETYIENLGYDAWETTFRCPNYDYDYFDRLDQEYAEYAEEIGPSAASTTTVFKPK